MTLPPLRTRQRPVQRPDDGRTPSSIKAEKEARLERYIRQAESKRPLQYIPNTDQIVNRPGT